MDPDLGMQPLTLKKTCDTCTKSKVKCSGGYPCSRCASKGIQCFYSPRKKRGTPKGKTTDLRQGPIIVRAEVNEHAAKGTLSTLADHERRSWSVFFTLYKHYGTSCSLYWFNRQLKKMRSYLKQRGDTAALKRLTTWMDAINVDIDVLTQKMNNCKIKMMSQAVIHPPGSVALWGIQGTVKDPEKKHLEQLQALMEDKKHSKTPFIKIKTKFLDSQQEGVEIFCNEAFSLVFGHTAENLEKELNWTGGGLLPWGGDVLGRVLSSEKDLLAFVQILAIKFNTCGPPKEIPCVREIPSCHMMNVDIKETSSNGKKVSVQCLIKCVHREVLKLEGSSLDISIDLTPLAPHDHLLDPKRVTSQVVLERPADLYRMKRRADDEEDPILTQEDPKKVRGQRQEDPLETAPVEEDIRIFDLPAYDPKRGEPVEAGSLGLSQGSVNSNGNKEDGALSLSQKSNVSALLKSKSVSMSELDEFIDGNIGEQTQEEYLTFDTEKSGKLDDALDTYVGEEDYGMEDDWFEGLLDWSSQTTVPKKYRPSTVMNGGIEVE